MSNEIKQDLNINKIVSQTKDNDLDYNNTQSPIEPTYEAMGDFILDTRNLDNQEINSNKFKKGIDEYSIIAGKMAVLTSMGIESKSALEFIEKELIREHDLKVIAQR